MPAGTGVFPQRSNAFTLLRFYTLTFPRFHAASRRRRLTLHVVRFTRPPAGASSMVRQAIVSEGKGADKLLSDKGLREYAEKMYLTPSNPYALWLIFMPFVAVPSKLQ
jgi:hypothetical protein